MRRLYFVCLIHNKIKVGESWVRFQERVQMIILRRSLRTQRNGGIPPHAMKSACDECQSMYPYFG